MCWVTSNLLTGSVGGPLAESLIFLTNVVTMLRLQRDGRLSCKLSKGGGLIRDCRQRDIRLAAGLTVSVQETTGSQVAFAALAHLGPTMPTHALRCILDVGDMITPVTADLAAPLVEGGSSPAVNGTHDAAGGGQVTRLVLCHVQTMTCSRYHSMVSLIAMS
ncbi:YgjV family protein [Halomonas maura]|uniref:YgjV family protein n=1 Tax=Halomonas maura TaxID=117606 RepID=UPI0025B4CA7F|nr:YgjV family protein [Halomonas maura]MDN3558157.1 YgjV family protein [Halomonas maura]